MPDESALELILRAEEAAQAALARLDVFGEKIETMTELARANHRLLQGNGDEGIKGRISHVERTANGNRKALDRIGSQLASSSESRWRTVREIAVALIAAAALVLSTFGGG